MRRLSILLYIFLAASLSLAWLARVPLASAQVSTGTPVYSPTAVIDTATPTPTNTPIPNQAMIAQPITGQALQGSIVITGTVYTNDFRSAELSFSYQDDPRHTWFQIADIPQTVLTGKLADWDTTTLTDGNYDLRLSVFRQDGNQLTFLVSGLRVRNYSSIETPTAVPPTRTAKPGASPLPPTATDTPLPSLTPIPPTATALPSNPVQVSQEQVKQAILQGAAGSAIIFLLMGLYVAARQRKK